MRVVGYAFCGTIYEDSKGTRYYVNETTGEVYSYEEIQEDWDDYLEGEIFNV